MNVQIRNLNWVKKISLSLDVLGRFNVRSEVQSEATYPNFSSPYPEPNKDIHRYVAAHYMECTQLCIHIVLFHLSEQFSCLDTLWSQCVPVKLN